MIEMAKVMWCHRHVDQVVKSNAIFNIATRLPNRMLVR